MYLTANGKVVELTLNASGFWADSEGAVYGLYDPASANDPVSRCGVSPIALPTTPYFAVLNEDCAAHDYAYSSPVYEAYHTRQEADDYLESLLSQSGYPIIGWLFRNIARLFGGKFWENTSTNN
jgi:hypothetical protein